MISDILSVCMYKGGGGGGGGVTPVTVTPIDSAVTVVTVGQAFDHIVAHLDH